ncbi:MATE family efflux transporter [Paenibacillus campi]|uniref:MATE family efflux transporter n=1 Tax=Paenibacillus campi TaxID=3106031 RepID=UPI002AFDE835|nr:MATE family efflux transporter [Paenibacillus sp. SGZ-1014]
MNQFQRLGEEKIGRLLVQFSLPAMIAMLVGALYNLIDRIFIGHSIGALGIAGITIGLPIMLLMWAGGTLVGVGGSSLVSIKLGEKKLEEAERIVGNSFLLLIVISILITLAGLFFITPLLQAYGASSEVLPYAKDYMVYIFAGTVLMLVGFGMNNFIRAEGNPKKAMITMLLGPLLNIAFAPLFIFGFGWGMKGVALATVLAQAVSTFFVLAHFYGSKSTLKIRLNHIKPDGAVIGKIIALGAAPFVMQAMSSLLNVLINNNMVKYGGDIAVSGIGVVASVQALVMMSIMGINQGVQPIIGYNYGAEKFDRVKKALTYALIAATVIPCLAFLMAQLFPEQMIAAFSNDKELIAFGSHAFRVYLLFLPIIGIQLIGSGYFMAIGKAKQAMFLSLARQVLIFIPALLILPRFFGVDGVLFSGPLTDLIATAITGILLLSELRNLNKEKRTNAAVQMSAVEK